VSQSELVLIKSYEHPGLNFQRNGHMPKVERTTWLCPSQPFSHRFGLPERFRPVQQFVNERSIVQIFLNVAQYLTGIGLSDQASISALTHGRPQLQAVERREKDGLPASARTVTQSRGRMVVGHVKRDQTGGVKEGFQRRNRERTSDAPGIGFGEMRLSRALKAATDFPGLFFRAGTSLIHGLPARVTMTVSPACAKSPIMLNPWAACCFVTVFMQQIYPRLELSAMAKSLEWVRPRNQAKWSLIGGAISLQTPFRIPLPIIPLPNLLCVFPKSLPRKAL
jgi:hypothetical protein